MRQAVNAPARGPRVGRLGWSLISLLALIALWELAAVIAQSRYLPGPAAVFDVMVREARAGELWGNIAATLIRVAFSFVIAMFIGSAIGLALGRYPKADRFFDAWLIFFLNLPALVIIVLCYIWFGLTEVAAITAVAINKIPNVAVTMREGARSLPRISNEMAHIYRFGWWKTLRHVTLPQLAPFFAAAVALGPRARLEDRARGRGLRPLRRRRPSAQHRLPAVRRADDPVVRAGVHRRRADHRAGDPAAAHREGQQMASVTRPLSVRVDSKIFPAVGERPRISS